MSKQEDGSSRRKQREKQRIAISEARRAELRAIAAELEVLTPLALKPS